MPKTQGHPNDASIGNRVRLRRMLRGMSQERLAELLGLSFQQVQKYEKGVNRIGSGRLWEIAGHLGVTITYFFEGLAPGAPADTEVHGLSTEAQKIALRIDQLDEKGRARILPLLRACLSTVEIEKEAA